MTKRKRAPRGSLSADQILDVASTLAGERGFDGFSMPELAAQLGFGVTSVYWYFRSRDELVAALADRATAEFYAGLDESTSNDLDDQVLDYFRTFYQRLKGSAFWRAAFINNPRFAIGSSRLAYVRSMDVHRREVARIQTAGLSTEAAAQAYTILSTYTRGYVVIRHYRDVEASEPEGVLHAWDLRDVDVVATTSNTAEEHLRNHIIRTVTLTADPDEEFELGLVALWNGLKDGFVDNGVAADRGHDEQGVAARLRARRKA